MEQNISAISLLKTAIENGEKAGSMAKPGNGSLADLFGKLLSQFQANLGRVQQSSGPAETASPVAHVAVHQAGEPPESAAALAAKAGEKVAGQPGGVVGAKVTITDQQVGEVTPQAVEASAEPALATPTSDIPVTKSIAPEVVSATPEVVVPDSGILPSQGDTPAVSSVSNEEPVSETVPATAPDAPPSTGVPASPEHDPAIVVGVPTSDVESDTEATDDEPVVVAQSVGKSGRGKAISELAKSFRGGNPEPGVFRHGEQVSALARELSGRPVDAETSGEQTTPVGDTSTPSEPSDDVVVPDSPEVVAVTGEESPEPAVEPSAVDPGIIPVPTVADGSVHVAAPDKVPVATPVDDTGTESTVASAKTETTVNSATVPAAPVVAATQPKPAVEQTSAPVVATTLPMPAVEQTSAPVVAATLPKPAVEQASTPLVEASSPKSAIKETSVPLATPKVAQDAPRVDVATVAVNSAPKPEVDAPDPLVQTRASNVPVDRTPAAVNQASVQAMTSTVQMEPERVMDARQGLTHAAPKGDVGAAVVEAISSAEGGNPSKQIAAALLASQVIQSTPKPGGKPADVKANPQASFTPASPSIATVKPEVAVDVDVAVNEPAPVNKPVIALRDLLTIPANMGNPETVPGEAIQPLRLDAGMPANLFGSAPKIDMAALNAVANAASTDAPMAQAEPVPMRSIPDFSIKNIKYMMENNVELVRVRLVPQSLGELHISVVKTNDVSEVIISSANPVVREFLETQMPGLREGLQQEGVQVNQVSVQARPVSIGGQSAEGNLQQQGSGNGSNSRGSHGGEPSSNTPGQRTARAPQRHDGVLNMYV